MMSLEDYVNQMQADAMEWFGYPTEDHELYTCILGLNGEAGEVADLLKKHIRGSMMREEMEELMATELIDVFHYWCLLVHLLKIDVEEVYLAKREFNAGRFGKSSETL